MLGRDRDVFSIAVRRRAKEGFFVEQHRWKLSLLRDFVKRFGWDELKRETVVPPGVRLYRWVTARRIDYRDDKIAHWLVIECEAISGWSWSVFDDAHRRNLDNLRQLIKKDGWDVLATKPVVDGVRLDRWVSHRREEHRQDELDAWLVRALEALPGWTWDPRRAGYERNLHDLREHVALNGWASIRTNTISRRGVRIGHWIGNIRAMHRRGETEKWLETELEAIPGWTWEPQRARQLGNIARLAAFVADHGWEAVTDALVVDEVKLGDWISNCRMRHRAGSLPKPTIRGLEAIAGWSWSGRTSWYQPKDKTGRFSPVPSAERMRRRNG